MNVKKTKSSKKIVLKITMSMTVVSFSGGGFSNYYGGQDYQSQAVKASGPG